MCKRKFNMRFKGAMKEFRWPWQSPGGQRWYIFFNNMIPLLMLNLLHDFNVLMTSKQAYFCWLRIYTVIGPVSLLSQTAVSGHLVKIYKIKWLPPFNISSKIACKKNHVGIFVLLNYTVSNSKYFMFPLLKRLFR